MFYTYKFFELACLVIGLILYMQYLDMYVSAALFIGLLVVIHRQNFNSTCMYISYDSFLNCISLFIHLENLVIKAALFTSLIMHLMAPVF